MARNSYFNENTLEELLEEIKYVYQSDKRPWVIGYSGGKDSTTVVELVYKMLQMLPKEERNKNVYIVSSDTLIENPLIKIYLSKMNKLLGEAAKKDDLPIISTMVTPPADNSFWANVIGRGFPTPRINGTFRWCTDRLKINPSANYIRLGSAPVNVKIQRLTEGDLVDDYQKEQSQFSRMIVEQVRTSIKMPNLDDVKSEEEAEKLLTDYFQNRFEDELLIYMKNVFIKMRELN